jgi:hypothetical protein
MAFFVRLPLLVEERETRRDEPPRTLHIDS